jgi:hypothetical protein
VPRAPFIRGRRIHDHFILVRQSAVLLQRRKIPAILLKLDVAWAFNSVSWLFLLSVLPELLAGLKHWVSLYADNVIVFARPAATKLAIVKGILACFGAASWLVVNYAKSVATPIRCSMDITKAIAPLLTAQSGSCHAPIKGCLYPPRSCERQTFNSCLTN